jgi:rubredoxin
VNGCWQCRECGYLYDPADGDPESRIRPATAFEQLPGNWCCPVCSERKSGFDPMVAA